MAKVLTDVTPLAIASVGANKLNFDSAIAQRLPYGPDTCRQGYVWHEAVPNDQTVRVERGYYSPSLSVRTVRACFHAHGSRYS